MPSRFKFRLEVVLAHRQTIEDERAADLAQAIQRRGAAERELAAMDADEARSLAEQTQMLQSTGFVAMDLDAFLNYRQGLAIRRHQGQRALERLIQEEARARQRLVEARKDREVLSQLKANQHQAWLQSLDAAERKLLDELATQAYRRPSHS